MQFLISCYVSNKNLSLLDITDCVDRSRVYVQVVHPRVERPAGDVRVHQYVPAGTGARHGDRGRGEQERHRLYTGEPSSTYR